MWSICFAIILLVISSVSVILENLPSPIPFLSVLPALINSSSGPLSAMCVVAVIAFFLKYKGNRPPKFLLIIGLYLLDLAIINKLYLNATWINMIKWVWTALPKMKTWNWPVIVITVFCLIVAIAMLVWGVHIWKRESAKRNTQHEATSKKQPSISKAQPESAAPPSITETPSSSNAHDTTPTAPSPTSASDTSSSNKTETPPSSAHFVICLLLILPAVALIQYVFYQLLPLGLAVPEYVNKSLNIILYLSTLCIAFVVILLLWISKVPSPNNTQRSFRRPAVLALILEILLLALLFFRKWDPDLHFLEPFLTSITNNALAALIIIPVVLFVILDIGISLFMNVFFEQPDPNKSGWKQEANQKLDEIQHRIVFFVLNIFIGVLNLLLFIPDFFNGIGSLLLDEDDLFPSFSKDPNPSKPTAPTPPAEDQGPADTPSPQSIKPPRTSRRAQGIKKFQILYRPKKTRKPRGIPGSQQSRDH